jgi:cathepsin E
MAARIESYCLTMASASIGPVGLTNGTLLPDTQTLVPTITGNMFTQGTITENLVAVSFEPTTELGAMNGELTFGGTDSSKFTGNITYV